MLGGGLVVEGRGERGCVSVSVCVCGGGEGVRRHRCEGEGWREGEGGQSSMSREYLLSGRIMLVDARLQQPLLPSRVKRQ